MTESLRTISLPLDTTITIYRKETTSDEGWIFAGNSGLAIKMAPDEWHLHFIPDLYEKPNHTPLKFSLIFASSFLSFINWWSNTKQDPEIRRPNKIISYSNNVMDRFWRQFFLTPEAYTSKQNTTHGRICDFNLKGLVKDRNIMERLTKWDTHCKKFNYCMVQL